MFEIDIKVDIPSGMEQVSFLDVAAGPPNCSVLQLLIVSNLGETELTQYFTIE